MVKYNNNNNRDDDDHTNNNNKNNNKTTITMHLFCDNIPVIDIACSSYVSKYIMYSAENKLDEEVLSFRCTTFGDYLAYLAYQPAIVPHIRRSYLR